MENEKVTPDVKRETTPAEEVKAQSVQPDAKPDQIPYARFKEIVASNNELKSKLDEFENAAEKQRVSELEKKGEYETLLGEVTKKYEVAKQKADQLDAYIAQDRDSILSNYDTEERDIIEALPLDKLKKYHTNNLSKQKLSVDASRAGVGQTTPKSFHEMTEDERRDPATWGAYLKSITRELTLSYKTIAADPSGISGNTELDVFIPEVWSAAVEGFLRSKLMFREMVTDYSSFVVSGGDKINVPSLSEVGVQAKTENAAIQYDSTTETNVQIAIDKHKYASKMFEDISLIQKNGDLVSQYASIMGYALAKQIDTDLVASLSDGSAGLNLTGITTGDDDALTDANIQSILATLGEADLDYRDGNVWMVVNPTLYSDLLHNDKFVRYDALGASNVSSGQLGSIFGMKVAMSNLIGTGGTAVAGMVFDSSACGFAMQKEIGAESQRDIDYLADKVVFSCLYGSKVIHRDRGLLITNND